MTQPEESHATVPVKRSLVRRAGRLAAIAAGYLVLAGMMLWAVLAIDLADLSVNPPRHTRAAIFGIAVVVLLLLARPRKYGALACLVLFAAVLIWYLRLQPSNQREWLADVAHTPRIQIVGEQMTVHNVRNFDYRSETDFTPIWEDRNYDLSKLRGIDFMLVYWGSKAIAHGMVSFVFDDGQYLAVSIETRKEKHEVYSALQGFFRQYELIYVFADERDVIRVRTDYRNEDVYLYRTNITPAQARTLLLDYVRRANELADRPDFYNALTSNCVTNITYSIQKVNPSARVTWETLLSGYAARQAYRNDRLDTRLPFEELEKRSHINRAAKALGNDPAFSTKIRQGLPNPFER